MTDFLGRLIARSFRREGNLAEGNLLRPRLPSLFEEPAADRSPAPAFAREETVEAGPDIARRTVSARTSAAGEPPSGRPHERPRNRSRFPAEPTSAGRSVALDEERRRPETHPAPAAWPGKDEERGHPAKRRPGAAPAARDLPVVVSVASPQPTSSAGPVTKIQSSGEKETRSHRPGQHPFAPPPPPPPQRPGAVAAGPPTAVDEAAPESHGPSQAATTAPVVRIHIGRIEVRAVTSSPVPVRKPVPIRPKLSLDEYLERRDGGRR